MIKYIYLKIINYIDKQIEKSLQKQENKMSKGSKRRPEDIKKIYNNWDKVFKNARKTKKKHKNKR
jgi:hypothetical protein